MPNGDRSRRRGSVQLRRTDERWKKRGALMGSRHQDRESAGLARDEAGRVWALAGWGLRQGPTVPRPCCDPGRASLCPLPSSFCIQSNCGLHRLPLNCCTGPCRFASQVLASTTAVPVNMDSISHSLMPVVRFLKMFCSQWTLCC